MDQLTSVIQSAVREAVKEALEQSAPVLSPRLLTLAQAAEYLGTAEWTIRNLMASKELPHVTLADKRGKLYFDRMDLDKLIANRKEGGRAA